MIVYGFNHKLWETWWRDNMGCSGSTSAARGVTEGGYQGTTRQFTKLEDGGAYERAAKTAVPLQETSGGLPGGGKSLRESVSTEPRAFGRASFDLFGSDVYWTAIGKWALAMLPTVLHTAFINWVADPAFPRRRQTYEQMYRSAVFSFLESLAQDAANARDEADGVRALYISLRGGYDSQSRVMQTLKDELSEAHAKAHELELRLQDARAQIERNETTTADFVNALKGVLGMK